MTTLFLNNAFVDAQQASVSVFDRSYLFGEGLFESFRSFDGKIPFLKDHINRLEWSAIFLEIPFSKDVDFEKVCWELLERNGLKEARFKIVLSGGGEEGKSNLVIFCEPFDEKKIPPVYRLRTEPQVRNESLPLAAMKTTSYLVKTYTRRLAREAGCDDAVLINNKGFVTETTTANIFWVDKDAHLFTVSSECGLLDGVMKKKLKELFVEHKIKCGENQILPNDLSSTREVFVTNSVIGIKPVVAVDGLQISGGETGPITQMVMDLWKKKL